MFLKWLRRVALLSFVLTVLPLKAGVNVNTFFESELAYNFERNDVRKTESKLTLEFKGEWFKDVSYTVIPTARLDLQSALNNTDNRTQNYASFNGPFSNSHHAVLEIFEAYVEFEALEGYWTLGKQQVVWGEADGLKVLDVVNPQDLRELNLDAFEESRIPTWMINGEFELPIFEESSLQVLLIPDLTFTRLADRGSDFEITTPLFRTQILPNQHIVAETLDKPTGEWEAGVRWAAFHKGWDFSFLYFNHFHDVPAVYTKFNEEEPGAVVLSGQFKRNNLYGLTATNAFEDWVIRTEIGYNSSGYFTTLAGGDGVVNSSSINSVLALDYHGFTDTLVSYQWFQTRLLDYVDEINRDRSSTVHTLSVRKDFWNDTLTLKWFGLFDHQTDDGELRMEVFYRYSDNLSLWAGIDMFYGRQEGLFGEFTYNDRLVLGFKYAL